MVGDSLLAIEKFWDHVMRPWYSLSAIFNTEKVMGARLLALVVWRDFEWIYSRIDRLHYDIIRAKPDGSCSRPATTGPSVL